jgi:predicted TPR repeat methyltransferase
MQPLFISSGDLVADRRYDVARQYWLRGDLEAAADVMLQATEIASHFTSAWFALGEIREELGDADGAIAAFRRARAGDVEDRHGAGLHLMRLGAEPMQAMPRAYVRTLFDQYAPAFERALLETLNYRGPRLLRDAVLGALRGSGRALHFQRAIDLGCGTGLGGRAFSRYVEEMIGCDLSSGMIEQARRSRFYADLMVGDMVEVLREQAGERADLIFAADALIYLGDLAPLLRETARVLRPQGLMAFTVETYPGSGVILGGGLRYQHGSPYVRAALAAAGLTLLVLTTASARDEGGEPVPGLVAVAIKEAPANKNPGAKAGV